MSVNPQPKISNPCDGSRRRHVAKPEAVARSNGLRYMLDDKPGYSRKRNGKGFVYYDTRGRIIKEEQVIERIRSLVIPPAWQNVWISPYENGHLQVTGIDARGRKQYRYHDQWRTARDASKYEKLISFARCLPAMRERVAEDLSRPGLPREKVLATVVRLLEATCIRVGNEAYARDNDSYGLTTLRNHHVTIRKCDINFKFTGKSGKEHNIMLSDCALASIVKKCRARSGEMLFQYVDENEIDRRVTSTDVNRYLREISGQAITAKDFRTWWGTVLAALALKQCELPRSQTAAKRQISNVVKQVAAHLGNTPTICRKCYIHPAVMEAFTEGRVLGRISKTAGAENTSSTLLAEERAVVRFLKQEWARK